MAHLDPKDAFEHLQSQTISALKTHFPIKGKVQTLHLESVEVKDAIAHDDLASQKDAKVKGKTWSVPVYGQLVLRNNETGEVVDKKKMRLIDIPKTTQRYSYIVGGQEYQVDSQWQLKAGAYVRRRDNGELETRFNVTGRPAFDIMFEPDKKRFLMEYGKSKAIPVYSVMKAMGVTDEEMEKAWGKQIFQANRSQPRVATGVEQFYKASKGVAAPTSEEAHKHLLDSMAASTMRPEAVGTTLGKPFSTVTGEALRLATEKMLRVQSGHPEDDRDSLVFKDLRTTGDFAYDRLTNGALKRGVAMKALRKLNTSSDIREILRTDGFQGAMHDLFHKNAAARVAAQVNPLEMLSSSQQTTIMGSGGIQSEQQITNEAKMVNASHLGFLDPIVSPEGSKTGVTLRLPMGAQKVGKEARTSLYNLKTGKIELVSPAEFLTKKVVFPDQVKWVDGKPVPRTDQVKMSVAGNELSVGSFKEADYAIRHPSQLFSMGSNMIPFLGSTSGNRATYGANQMGQAISLLHREQPLVQSGTGLDAHGAQTFEQIVGGHASQASPTHGTVKSITKDRITILGHDGKTHEVPVYNDYPLNDAKSHMNSTPLVKVGDSVKTGQVLADTNYTHKGALALGANLEVAYIPYKGYNFEDGVVISQDAAKKLTSMHMHRPELALRDQTILDKQKFMLRHPMAYTKDQLSKIGDGGTIKVGQIVHAGDPLVLAMNPFELKDRQGESAIRKSLSGAHSDSSIRWDSDFPGTVVDVHHLGDKVAVHIKTLEPAQVGDKVSGRHGNKGIISLILPTHEMPQKKDGTHIDVALNPSGVPGRMNIGQVLEVAAGKIAQKTGKTYVVNNFDPNKDYLAHVESELKAHGLSDTEELFDPTTKQSLGKTMTGPMHVLKLVHQVEKKGSARAGMGLPEVPNSETYNNNLQPTSGGGVGGQSIGTLGMYALLANGARANIREMQTWKSEGPDPNPNQAKRWKSQHTEVWNAIQTNSPLPTPKMTFAFQKFGDILRASGVNMDKKGHEFILTPMTDKQVLSMSQGRALPKPTALLTNKTGIDGNPKPSPGGLFDEQLTGGHGGTNWTHIPLAEPMPNPLFEAPIRHITGLKEKEYDDLVAGRKFLSSAGTLSDYQPGYLTGGAAIKHLLEKVDVKKDLEQTKKALTTAPAAKIDKLAKKAKYLRALDSMSIKPADAYILHNLPVLPPVMRPVSQMKDGALQFADMNGLYAEFAQANEKLGAKDLNKVLREQDKHQLRGSVYDGLKAIMGVGVPYKDAKLKGLLHQIGGASPKQSYFQDVLINRRTDLSMRSTIVPEPSLSIDEVGLPKAHASTLFRPFVIEKLVSMGYARTPLQAQEMLAKKPDDPGVHKALEKVMEERPVLLKRDPALHKYSVQGFMPKLVEGSAIKIHPLVTGGYNADFDGDSCLGEIIIATTGTSRYTESGGVDMPHTGNIAALGVVNLEDFPRIESSATTNKRGVIEYRVPEGVYVPAYLNGTMLMMPVSEYSVHPNCEEWLVQTSRGRELRCSSEHSLAVLDPETLEVRKTSPRDAVGLCSPVLRGMDDAGIASHLPGFSPTNPRAIKMLDSVPLDRRTGWFIGASIGDGWVTETSRPDSFQGKYKEKSEAQNCQTHLAHGKGGEKVADVWVVTAEELSGARALKRAHLPHEFEGKEYTSFRETISATALGRWLLPLIGKSSHEKHLPPDFLSYPIECRRGLFCGLLDTDGTVNWVQAKAKPQPQFQCSYTTVSKTLADGIQLLAMSLGLPSSRTAYTHRDRPVYSISFSSRPLQEATWIELLHENKAASLSRLRATEDLDYGRNDFVPLPEWAREELLELLREMGATRKTHLRTTHGTAALSQYTVLNRRAPVLTRVSFNKLLELLTSAPLMLNLSERLERWIALASDLRLSWDLVTHAEATGETKTMYDLTVPDAWTFTMADGLVVWDTMSVFVPISKQAVTEAHKMKPSNNLFSDATGKLAYMPGLESSLGLYKLSQVGKDTGKSFKNPGDILMSMKDGQLRHDDVVALNGKKTTPGRILLSTGFPEQMQNNVLHNFDLNLDKKGAATLLTEMARKHNDVFDKHVNKLKDLGNGASFGVVQVPLPGASGVGEVDPHKYVTIPMTGVGTHTLSLKDFQPDREVRNRVLSAADAHMKLFTAGGKKTELEKENETVRVFTRATEEIKKQHEEKMKSDPNNLYMMHRAGVKPDWTQYQQMALAPMLVKDSANRTIPHPIRRSLGEGLDVAEYWTTMHGARRGVVMKVQEVQEPGYMTKLMQNNTMHLMVTKPDCGTTSGILMDVNENGIHDRHLQQELKIGHMHLPVGTMLTSDVIAQVKAHDKNAKLLVRSPIKCEDEKGICQKCSGLDSSGKHYELGANTGVLASHAIGERAVQLTLKAFHTGGAVDVSGGGKALNAFGRFEQLMLLPKTMPNSATLSMANGTIDKVEHDPTGTVVTVNGQPHHIPKDARGNLLSESLPGFAAPDWQPPKVGMSVKAGQPLSDPLRTYVNPHDLYKATKSIEKVQNHMIGEIYGLYKEEGVRRQHVETLVKAMSNLTKVKSSGDSESYVPGEFVSTSALNKHNQELTKAGRQPVLHEPVLMGLKELPRAIQNDWMARLQHDNLRTTLMEGAALGSHSDIHSTHPIPAAAFGAEFGLTEKNKQTPGLGHLHNVPGHHY